MGVGNLASSCEKIELCQQAHYWQAQHKCSIARESQLQAKVRSLGKQLHSQKILIQEQSRPIEALTSQGDALHIRKESALAFEVCTRYQQLGGFRKNTETGENHVSEYPKLVAFFTDFPHTYWLI